MKMRLDEVGLLKFGHSIQMAGTVYVGEGRLYFALFPDEDPEDLEVVDLGMDRDDWTRFLRQSDLLETEVLAQSSDGTLAKAILRKSQRQISQDVSWRVYRRDKFACRYCSASDVPLTVDHLVLWEENGPSTEANLLSTCKKCNKTRGNTEYAAWLEHPYYRKVSKNLDPPTRQANQDLIATLSVIPRMVHQPTHR